MSSYLRKNLKRNPLLSVYEEAGNITYIFRTVFTARGI